MRYSFHRESVLNIVKGSTRHLTADSIHKKLKRLIPNVSKMTVYRNLNQLSDSGKILEFYVDHTSHYCGTQSNHIHFACVCCNEVVDNGVVNPQLTEFIESKKFSPIASGFVIKGICMHCKKTNNNN